MKTYITLLFITFSISYANISGVAYFEFEDSFSLSRTYFTYKTDISDELSFKLQTDVGRLDTGVDDDRWTVYLKKAHLDWKVNSDMKISMGMIGMNMFNVQEKTWGNRFLKKSAMDEYKFSASADLGFAITQKLGPVTASVLMSNGEGYKGGLEKKTATIKVDVPKGVSNGNYIPIRGQGNQSNSGSQDGDLIVYFEEKDHKLYSRDGQDVYIDSHLHYHQLVGGTEIDIPTLGGKIKMKIPAGMNSGQILRIKGKGFAYLNSTKSGDQFVRINLITPLKISKKMQSILDDLESEVGNEVLCKKYNH